MGTTRLRRHPAGKLRSDASCPRYGLTLLELLVAVALIGILAALAVPGLAAAKRVARLRDMRGRRRLWESQHHQ